MENGPNPYYPGNLPFIFSNTLRLVAYPFPNMVLTKITTTGGNQSVQMFVMTPSVTTLVGGFSLGNLVPCFQPPT
jgi:hypothetical protein